MSIQIDPQLLFQRLTLVAKSIDSLEDVFRFELCSYPPALFSSAQFLHEAHKPVLADAIWSFQPGQGIPGLPREQLQEQLFDSYRDKSTKDITHQRRNKGQTGAMVTFTENMHLTMRKYRFPANKENKQRFINMLSMKLVERSCKTYHDSGGTDLLIVQKSVESAPAVITVLVGDDTDLLILLIYHASLDLGCDTTSQLHWIGKGNSLKKFRLQSIP